MKKLYFTFIALTSFLFLSQSTMAQDVNTSFQEGDVVINAGLGLGTTFAFTGSLGIPLGGGVEYGITDAIGVGGEAGFASGGGLTVFYIGAKGSYHFNDLFNIEDEAWDVYGGLGLYYRSFNVSGINFGLGSGITAGIHAGARYYFSDSFGVYAELGNSYAWLKAGVVLKL
ncbi:hypothetical protein KUV50_17635 [Membranicola marinus]|uniref:Outer membrane protein beta-barrel domain-containing protein n=1 Tax=Membranihabitans marinus TaxID=1227546 RepID=A0A953HQM1_9BACT|nr:hypothetical protein [Membranihabitans marinus]MBY5959977.1 hypothetical protein [Membranihabitans marinus]